MKRIEVYRVQVIEDDKGQLVLQLLSTDGRIFDTDTTVEESDYGKEKQTKKQADRTTTQATGG